MANFVEYRIKLFIRLASHVWLDRLVKLLMIHYVPFWSPNLTKLPYLGIREIVERSSLHLGKKGVYFGRFFLFGSCHLPLLLVIRLANMHFITSKLTPKGNFIHIYVPKQKLVAFWAYGSSKIRLHLWKQAYGGVKNYLLTVNWHLWG